MGAVKISRCMVCGKAYFPTPKWPYIYYLNGRVMGACSEKCKRTGQNNADKAREERRARR